MEGPDARHRLAPTVALPLVTRVDAERLVKISRDNIFVPIGRRSPGCPKIRWSDLIIN